MSMQDFIPDGFVPLADWDHRNRANNDGHSAEWKTLGDAARAGDLPAFKLSNGRWYVHREKAVELLADSVATTPRPVTNTPAVAGIDRRQLEAAVIALCEINNGISLMHVTLERLTAAVESIATQPKSAQQELLATISSNGFHN